MGAFNSGIKIFIRKTPAINWILSILVKGRTWVKNQRRSVTIS